MNSNVKTDNRTIRAYAIAMWLACALVASNAYADDQVRNETVKFADLNLGTPAGGGALYGRGHAAARRVCDQPAGGQAGLRAGMTKTASEAIGKGKVPRLAPLFPEKTGKHPQKDTPRP